jgi:hypothetical protein
MSFLFLNVSTITDAALCTLVINIPEPGAFNPQSQDFIPLFNKISWLCGQQPRGMKHQMRAATQAQKGMTLRANLIDWSNWFSIGRVNRLVTEYLSTQGKPDQKGGLHCFWCSNQNWTPPLGASETLTIVKNGLEMYTGFMHPKNSLYFSLLPLEFKDDS